MKRDQLAHILRAAARIANDDEVIVIGSQAILGSFDEDDLPEPAYFFLNTWGVGGIASCQPLAHVIGGPASDPRAAARHAVDIVLDGMRTPHTTA
ncbi:hypothetical protein N802_11050 [Knoellia sinensis KCTC 19936]|uniref:Uncharacterized protein n=1 Tax=Knoellia sinensis KCTC 19936 TaxID=1385520 RepID=A0A0A0J806_9MICO|nr:hypothetical protein [Knoellia sinensis]KGN32187.1 hypothetical protein N802_11050 [Knoellia sinensis KCTC 19936]